MDQTMNQPLNSPTNQPNNQPINDQTKQTNKNNNNKKVIGNGAILETTSILGPHMATSQSPKTGERLVTLASEDKSFEFHLKVDRVAKVTFTETDRPATATTNKKTLRIVRFVGEGDEPICSLILADASTEATEWFKDMTIRYGYAWAGKRGMIE